MSPTDIAVTLAGLAGIAWVNWYFFVAGSRAVAVADAAPGDVQRIGIEVKGAYSPATIRVTAGRPVRLELHRAETNGCSEEIVLGDFGIRRYLPAHETTAVEFTPEHPGRYDFTCGMGMLHGTLIVDAAAGSEAHHAD